MKLCVALSLLLFSNFISLIFGHGMVLDPPSRGSRWRFNSSAPCDYNDNGANCGGRGVQYRKFKGNCGICGDIYGDKPPRSHELGGTFGEGVIVGNYKSADIINVTVMITANHLGHFQFELCNLDNQTESEECFQEISLLSNSTELLASGREGYYKLEVELPENVTCNHCILRWTYVTGNSWGTCEDGNGGLGCGDQENFKTCSDIKIIENPDDDDVDDDENLIEPKHFKIDDDGMILTTADNADSETATTSPDEDAQIIVNELSTLMKSLKSHFGKVNEVFKDENDNLIN